MSDFIVLCDEIEYTCFESNSALATFVLKESQIRGSSYVYPIRFLNIYTHRITKLENWRELRS